MEGRYDQPHSHEYCGACYEGPKHCAVGRFVSLRSGTECRPSHRGHRNKSEHRDACDNEHERHEAERYQKNSDQCCSEERANCNSSWNYGQLTEESASEGLTNALLHRRNDDLKL